MSDQLRKANARRILIVGDPALSRTLMKMVLARLDYVVTCTVSAREAGEALAHTRFALVLVALQLPDMPGLTFARRLRGNDAAMTPILLFGDAWDQDAVLQDVRAAGLDGYLPKPISIARLVARVCELTRQTLDSPFGVPAMVDEASPIALEHFTSFTDGDEQLERELGSLYLATAGTYVDEMRAALAAGLAWDGPAHSLKGASANIGAVEVAALAAEAEAGQPSEEQLGRITTALGTVRRFFELRTRGEYAPHLIAAD